MHSKAAFTALRDIAYHIDLAAHSAEGFTDERFRADLRTVYAVTRCLEIISEASRRLPAEMKARHPSIAWKDVAEAGAVYRHDYEDVAPNTYGTPCKSTYRRCAPQSNASWLISAARRHPEGPLPQAYRPLTSHPPIARPPSRPSRP